MNNTSSIRALPKANTCIRDDEEYITTVYFVGIDDGAAGKTTRYKSLDEAVAAARTLCAAHGSDLLIFGAERTTVIREIFDMDIPEFSNGPH